VNRGGNCREIDAGDLRMALAPLPFLLVFVLD